jgi:predicted nucleic acid-binding protein
MYLLDTNVISELRKVRLGKADAQVATWADNVSANELYMSVISVQELETGVLLIERRDAAQGSILRAWLENQVLPAFEGRILPVDVTVARHSAKLHVPNPQPARDSLIAATALVHSMTVVTRNIEDFRNSGVQLINPWDKQT